MVIYYGCRHCGKELGMLDYTEMDVSSHLLNLIKEPGITEMMAANKNGHFCIEVICEYCQQTLEVHPDYHELDYFLQ